MEKEEFETIVLNVFRTVLQNPALSAADDFFASDGDSMLAIEAAIQISESIGSETDITLIIMYPTAAELAGALADLKPVP